MSLHLEITQRLLIAMLFGGAVGLERSYHGRPAGFRTHTLVCISTCLLMLISSYEAAWNIHPNPGLRFTLDPTRMAQGIMTGIGFLGAGAIVKEGLTVHGLTTAASIWTTAAIGVLTGIGFFYPATLTLGMTLGVLGLFRWLERIMPSQFYAKFSVRFEPDGIMQEQEMRAFLTRYGFTIANLCYQLGKERKYFEYRMVIRTDNTANVTKLAEALETTPSISAFELSATVD